MADIIDLTTFRKNESQQLSLYELIEQAETLVVLQRSRLVRGKSAAPKSGVCNPTVVANSLKQLRRHLGSIKRMVAQL